MTEAVNAQLISQAEVVCGIGSKRVHDVSHHLLRPESTRRGHDVCSSIREGVEHHDAAEHLRLLLQMGERSFEFWERVRGREMNVVDGLVLHTCVLTELEQVMLEASISGWVQQGTRVGALSPDC